jgi:hypothetical protein
MSSSLLDCQEGQTGLGLALVSSISTIHCLFISWRHRFNSCSSSILLTPTATLGLRSINDSGSRERRYSPKKKKKKYIRMKQKERSI